MRLILSFAALFLSVILLQLSSGAVGPLDALSGIQEGFSKTQVGVLGSAHFVGFFIGCWWAPRLMGAVGHSRAFAVFTALGAIGLLGHTLVMSPIAWAMLRVGSGLCIAGCYTVVEAWLNAKITNESRGRTMGTYRFVDISASLVSQMLIGALASVEMYLAYNLLALMCCASLLPLAMTKSVAPSMPSAPRLRPVLAFQRSPLAVAGVIVAGLATASYRMVGPIYGTDIGLNPAQIGLFLASFVAGGALAQYPAGWVADRFDRRFVLIGFSLLSLVACVFSTLASGVSAVYVASAFFGFVTFPIYSVAAAHAHDFAGDDERIELSAALIFFYAVGAIAAPVVASRIIEVFGPSSFFAFIALGHAGLALFSLWRMTRRATVEDKTPYVYAPRTSFTIGKLMKRLRDRG